MSQIILEVPNESLLALRSTPEAAGSRLLLAAAVKLYEMGELSSGAAARLAGLPRVVFLSKLTALPGCAMMIGILPLAGFGLMTIGGYRALSGKNEIRKRTCSRPGTAKATSTLS